MRAVQAGLGAAMLLFAATSAQAMGILISYSGSVDEVDPGLAGVIELNDIVTGSVLIDLRTAKTTEPDPAGSSSVGYNLAIRQFNLTLGDYTTEFGRVGATFLSVQNDNYQGAEGIVDGISARASLDGDLANGAALANATFALFTQNLSVLSSGNLPTAEEINGFLPGELIQQRLKSSISWVGGGVHRARWQVTSLSATTVDVPVPEPSTALLVGFGFAAMALAACRLRRDDDPVRTIFLRSSLPSGTDRSASDRQAPETGLVPSHPA